MVNHHNLPPGDFRRGEREQAVGFALPDTIIRFSDRLQELSHNPRFRVDEMPDLTPQVNHDGGEVDPDALRPLEHAYFTPDLLGEEGKQPVRYEFALKEGWSMGRDESQHQAFFGIMNLTWAGGQTRSMAVAVKEYPYPLANLAVKEQGLLQDLGERGLPAVKPVGIIMNRWSMDPGVFVLTKMEGDLESLNAQDWSRLDPAEARERVAPVSDTLALLHGEGIFPHEMAFGNVGVGESEGSRFIFDLESAKSFRNILDKLGPDDPLPEELLIAFRQDFTPPRVSFRDFVYPNLPPGERPATPEELFQFEFNLLYEPYHMAILQSGSKYTAVLERAYRAMMSHMQKEAEEGIYGLPPKPGKSFTKS